MRTRSILLVSPSFPPAVNGLANVAYAYAKKLTALGYTVEIFTPGPSSYTFDGLHVACLPIHGSLSLRNLPNGAIRQYVNFLRSHPANLAICHAFQTVATDLALAFFPRRKIYHSHGVSWRSGLSENSLRAAVRRVSYFPYEIVGPTLLKCADAAVFLGQTADCDRTFDAKYFHHRPHSVIPNGSYFAPGTPRRLSQSRLKLLAVGACTREKGYARLARLVRLLNKAHVQSLTICTMSNSPFLPQFQALVEGSTDFPIRYVFDKSGTDLEPFYADADALINLSISECHPLVMADAVNSRLPTLCFDTGYQKEVGGAKLFASVEAVAHYINSFSTNAEELRALSESTCPRSWDSAGHELAQFIQRLDSSSWTNA